MRTIDSPTVSTVIGAVRASPGSVAEAVLVTAVTIAAQVTAVTPGGLGTYEAAATAVLAAVGCRPRLDLRWR